MCSFDVRYCLQAIKHARAFRIKQQVVGKGLEIRKICLEVRKTKFLFFCICFSILLTHEGSHREVYRDFQSSLTPSAGPVPRGV